MNEIGVIDRDGAHHSIKYEISAENLMEIIRDSGLPLLGVCGGNGICSTCHVYVDPAVHAAFPKPDLNEIELLQDTGFYDTERSRLSCQLEMADCPPGMVVVLAPE